MKAMENLRFGLIGAGYFGKHYLRLLKELPDVELKSVATKSSVETTPDAILRDPEIDCVVIATPARTHFDLATRALLAGKHVLVEKPLVLNLSDAAELKKLVEKTNKVLMVGHQYLYNDYIQKLKDEISRGTLGEIKYIFAEHMYFGPLRSDTGVFFDAATHEFAILDYLFGPFEIEKAQGASLSMTGKGFDDFAAAEIRFSNGILFTIVLSRFAPQKIRRMVFGGSRGLALFDEGQDVKLSFYNFPYPEISETQKLDSNFFETAPGDIAMPQLEFKEPLRAELEHFVNCVQTGDTPKSDIEHGVRVTGHLTKVAAKIGVIS